MDWNLLKDKALVIWSKAPKGKVTAAAFIVGFLIGVVIG